LAVFALGVFTDFEILDAFQRTGLFKSKKTHKICFFCRKSLTLKMRMSRILTFITNFCSSDEGLQPSGYGLPPAREDFRSNSCLKLNSIWYKSQNREAN